MAANGANFPIGIIHYSAPPTPGGVERVAAGQARALARTGRPVRLVVGSGRSPSPDVDVRRVGELSSTHPRILEMTSALARGEVPEDFDTCVLDLAQAIGRELVGCGTVFVHNCLTMPFNLPATEAIRRLEKGSRGPPPPGGAERRWVVWAHDCAAASERYRAFHRKEFPWSLLREPLPGARHVTVSEARRAVVAKALKLAQRDVLVVPNGVDCAEFLDLTPNVRELARAMRLFEADLVLLTPARAVERKGLDRGLDIVRALSKSKRGFQVRWLVTAPVDPHRPPGAGLAGDVLGKLIAKRDKLGLAGSVVFLSAEPVPGPEAGTEGVSEAGSSLASDWAHPTVDDADLRSLYRLADCLLFPSDDEGFGIPVLEAALAREVIVLGPAPALEELVKGTGKGKDANAGVVILSPRETPAASAKRILAALKASPAWYLRRRVLRELDWDAIAEEYLIPLVEGRDPARKAGRKR